jgi:hypothetical protein
MVDLGLGAHNREEKDASAGACRRAGFDPETWLIGNAEVGH